MKELQLADIHNLIKLGLPPAIPRGENPRLWETDRPNDAWGLPDFARLAVNTTLKEKGRQRIERDSADPGSQSSNARQYMATLRTQGETDKIAMPAQCQECAPETPNVYTDGSLKNPRYHQWSQGGFGIWWPSRNLTTKPLSSAEEDYTLHEHDDQGVKMWGWLPGGRSSSTRTELAAGLIAATGPGGIHQATDSRAYSDMVNALLAGKKPRGGKPWGIVTNGDLWEQMEKVIECRGADSMKVTWVKGHANNKENERCDVLAVQAAESNSLIADNWYEKNVKNTGTPLF